MDINTLREYIKIHIISLEQDLEPYDDFIIGSIHACEHILGVIDER
jgi:hypothetical protein